MIFDILKGAILVVFTIIMFILGLIVEIVCVPIGRFGKELLINKFIDELWINAYKH